MEVPLKVFQVTMTYSTPQSYRDLKRYLGKQCNGAWELWPMAGPMFTKWRQYRIHLELGDDIHALLGPGLNFEAGH